VHVQRSLPVQGVTPEQFGQFYAGTAATPGLVDTYNSFGIEARLNRASSS
jgi:hypothetical protein